MTTQENPGIKPYKKEQQPGKKKKGSPLMWRDGEVGGGKARSNWQTQEETWPLSPFLVPSGRSSRGSNQTLTWTPYVESRGLKHSFCFYLLFLWGIHFGSNFPFLLWRLRDFEQSRDGIHSGVLGTCQILLQFFLLAYYGMEIWSFRHVGRRRLFWFLPFWSLIRVTIIEQPFHRRPCPALP